VFVTDDGANDLDLGHYERFNRALGHQDDNITTGRIYKNIIERERRGDTSAQQFRSFRTLQREQGFLDEGNDEYDFVICEIGGTVGDIEAMPFMGRSASSATTCRAELRSMCT